MWGTLHINVSAFLDLRIFVVYPLFMKRILTILFSIVLIFAGIGSVPRCYVMKPDCDLRGTVRCPLSHTAVQGCVGCPHMAQQQKTHTVPPVDRLARFSIDQERHCPDLSPDCVPVVAVVQNSQLISANSMHDREISPNQLRSTPEPPLIILLQKQSLLI